MFGLVLIVSWVDDMLAVGSEESLENLSIMLQDRIECEESGKLKEFLGCKLDREGDILLITQPMLVEALKDEFKLDKIKARKFQLKVDKCYLRTIGMTTQRVRIKHIEGE